MADLHSALSLGFLVVKIAELIGILSEYNLRDDPDSSCSTLVVAAMTPNPVSIHHRGHLNMQ